MRNYQVDPLLTSNLVFELSIKEEKIKVLQMSYLVSAFRQRVNNFTKEELIYLSSLLWEAYNKLEGKDNFIGSLLDVVEEKLKSD